MAGSDFALLIGNGDYGAELTKLLGPPNDVAAFAEWLVDPQGGAVPPGQVFVLCDGQPALPAGVINGGLAQHQQIYNQFFAADAAAAALTAAAARPQRRLWLLFAGHGNMPARQYGVDAITACFVAQDWGRRSAFAGRVVPVEFVKRWIDTFEEFDEVVVFMDCCRSEESDIFSPANPMGAGAGAAALARRFAVLCACQPDRLAYELPVDGGGPMRGVFTTAILDGLKTLRDSQNRLGIGQLRDYVVSTYADRYKDKRVVPRPDLLDDEASRNFILIGGAPPTPMVTFRRKAETPVQYVQLVSGDHTHITGFRLDAPVDYPLRVGAYFVLNRQGQTLTTFEHSSAEGEIVDV